MKININRESLLKPLQMVSGIVERRQTLPILSNVKITAQGEQLRLVATDLEVEMRTTADAEVQKPGETTIPARKFVDICRALPEGSRLEIALEKERVRIRSGKSRFTLATLPADEFPGLETDKALVEVDINAAALKLAIERTHFAMAQQDVRYYLNGTLFEVSKDMLRLVATDGHRLAISEADIQVDIDERQSVIVPRKAVQELLRLLPDGEQTAAVKIGSNFLHVNTAEMTFATKLIDGRFPDYQNVVPVGGDKHVICERADLRQALGRAAILSNEKYRGVRLVFAAGELKIFAHNPEQEEAEEEISVDYNGAGLEIGFNVNYLMDAISAGVSEQVKMTLSDANSCCLIQGMGEKNSRYIVMPMRL